MKNPKKIKEIERSTRKSRMAQKNANSKKSERAQKQPRYRGKFIKKSKNQKNLCGKV